MGSWLDNIDINNLKKRIKRWSNDELQIDEVVDNEHHKVITVIPVNEYDDDKHNYFALGQFGIYKIDSIMRDSTNPYDNQKYYNKDSLFTLIAHCESYYFSKDTLNWINYIRRHLNNYELDEYNADLNKFLNNLTETIIRTKRIKLDYEEQIINANVDKFLNVLDLPKRDKTETV